VAPQVLLEALELDDRRARNVGDGDRREIGLAGHGADAGELAALAAHLVVAVGVRGGNGDQVAGRLEGHPGSLSDGVTAQSVSTTRPAVSASRAIDRPAT